MRILIAALCGLALLSSCEPPNNSSNETDDGATVQMAPTQPGAGGKTKADLEKDGYKCEVVSVDQIECTKSGSDTYICDNAGKQCKKSPFSGPSDSSAIDSSVISGDDLNTNENEM